MSTTAALATEAYNRLLGIADANRRLEELGGEDTVGKVLSTICGSGLEHHVGVRLLHKHNDIFPSEIMLESSIVDEEGFSLVTKATTDYARHNVITNSWHYLSKTYISCEFSRAALLSDPHFVFDDHGPVFKQFAEALHDYGVQQVLGPCLHYGENVKSHMPAPDAVLLEKTDSENRANVARFVDSSDPSIVNSAKTKWAAIQHLECDGRIVWTTVCSCFCSVFPQGGHQGTKTHRYSP